MSFLFTFVFLLCVTTLPITIGSRNFTAHWEERQLQFLGETVDSKQATFQQKVAVLEKFTSR